MGVRRQAKAAPGGSPELDPECPWRSARRGLKTRCGVRPVGWRRQAKAAWDGLLELGGGWITGPKTLRQPCRP
eukprot:2153364-Alexandrium_andersonii.AAC.1